MSKTIKVLVIAGAVAASASSAFAASVQHRERASTFERYSDPPVFEGRYSALYAGRDDGMTNHEGLVDSVGN